MGKIEWALKFRQMKRTVCIWEVDVAADVEADGVRGYYGAESPSNISALRCNTMAAFLFPVLTCLAYCLRPVRHTSMLSGNHYIRNALV